MLKNVDEVKVMLELAAEVDKSLPKVQAMGVKSTWPELRLSNEEIEAIRLMTQKGKPAFSPQQADIDVWYKVCTEWVKAFTGNADQREQWSVIWLKSCGCPSKIIESKLGICRTKVWYVYDRGLERLLNYLGVAYTSADINKNEYRPELIPSYPAGKIKSYAKINLLREWLSELEKKR